MGTVEGKKQEKRRALLEAAYDLFLERGAAKTSVEDITSRAKVAKGTFYLYFQDKGAVMQALFRLNQSQSGGLRNLDNRRIIHDSVFRLNPSHQHPCFGFQDDG